MSRVPIWDQPCDRCGKVHPHWFIQGQGRVNTCPGPPLDPERYSRSIVNVHFEPWTKRITRRLADALAAISKAVGQ